MFILQDRFSGKPVSFSAIEGCKIPLFEEHMNPHGVLFGSRILELVSSYAAQVALAHSGVACRTAGIDFVRFFAPAKREDGLVCKAAINHCWENSMEVGVRVVAEDFRSLEQKHVLSAYFTYEALDAEGRILVVPKLILENEEQKRRFSDAERRRLLRIKRLGK
ncbi:MAG: hotdog domain-containing protein [Parachlamydiales bacterium]|jgi:acyl-CoA hydrolase